MMIFKFSHRAFLLMGILILAHSAMAQFSESRMMLKEVPDILPASSAPDAGWYISIPAISSVNLAVYNSGFTYNDIVGDDDSLKVNALFDELHEVNSLSYQLNYQLFQAGFRIKDKYFKLALSEKSSTRFDYTENLLKLAWLGNGHEEFIGNTVSMSGMAVNSMTYTDIALGFSMPVMDKKFRMGVNFHYLNGIAAVQTERSDLSIYTDPENYNIRLNGEFEMNTAGFADGSEEDGDEEYKFEFFSGNHGFALDVGAEGFLTDKIYGTLLISDLGFIKWQERTYNYKSEGNFDFRGLPLNKLVNKGAETDDYLDSYVDSLTGELQLDEYAGEFKTALNTQIAFTGGYHLNDNHEFGISGSYTKLYTKGIFTPAAYYRLKIKKFAGVYTQFSLYDLRHFNTNIGFWLRGGPLMLHVATYNLPAVFYPLNHHNTGLSVGLNLLFNRDKETPPSKALY